MKRKNQNFFQPFRILSSTLTFLLIITALPARALEIAIFNSKNLANYNDAITGFKVNCSAKFSEYNMEESSARGEKISTLIQNSKPDLVLAVGIHAALTASRRIRDIPVVFAMVLNPQKYDLAGENITGVSLEIPVKTQLNTLKSIVPKISKVGVIYNPRKSRDLIKEAYKVAEDLELNLVTSKVDQPRDTPRAFRAFSAGIDAYWLIPDPTVVTREAFQMILDYTYKNSIPFMAFSKSFVDAGALVSLAPNYPNVGKQACEIAQQIIQGKKPSSIPVQSPKGLELTFNLNTSKKLGLDFIATQAITFAAREGYKINVTQ